MPFANRPSRRHPSLGGRRRGKDDCFLERISLVFRGRWSFELFKVPRSCNQSNRHRLRFRLGERACEEGQTTDAELRRLSSGDGPGASQRCRPILRLADADEQYALDARAGAREVQRLITSAAKVATLERAAQDAAKPPIQHLERPVDARARRKREDEQWRIERTEVCGARGESEGHLREEKKVRRPAMAHDPIPLIT